MIYLKIKEPDRIVKGEGFVKRSIRFFLKLIIPKANPDYDGKISLVTYWLLEFEGKDSVPDREIGLGINEEVILKMPYRDNYGYWLDNNLTFEDFHDTFEAVEITREDFEEKWKVEPVR